MSREESFSERYSRLNKKATELFQKQKDEALKKALDAYEEAIEKRNSLEILRCQLLLDALLEKPAY